MIAVEFADYYPRFAPTMLWDNHAGIAIFEHAGFNVIDWVSKKSMLYNIENFLNNWFLVAKSIQFITEKRNQRFIGIFINLKSEFWYIVFQALKLYILVICVFLHH